MKRTVFTSDAGYKGWDKGSVERIVKSETYAGTLVQGRTSITARDEKNRIHKAEDDWVVTKDAHEPLVDRELYQKAAEVRGKIQRRTTSRKHPASGCPIGENIFGSVLYCGVCGRKMTRNSYVKQYADGEKARLDGYFCLNGGQTKVPVCPDSNRISKNELLDLLLPLIRMEFAVFLNKPDSYIEYGEERIAESIKKAERALRETEGKIRRSGEEESSIYMDYRSGKIPQKEYVAFKMKQEDRLADLRRRQEEQQKERKALDKLRGKYLSAVRALLKLKSGKELTKDMTEAFISKIYVYPQQKERKALDKLRGKYLSAVRALLKLKSGKELTKDMTEAFISKIYVYPRKRIEVIFTFTADCMEGVK